MSKFEDGIRAGKHDTQKKLITKYESVLTDLSLVIADIKDLIDDIEPKSPGIFASIGSMFGVKPKEPEKKLTEHERGYEEGIVEEKTRFVKLFMDWFDSFKTMDSHTFKTKLVEAVHGDKDSLEWNMVLPNTKDPPHSRLAPGKYRS